MSCTGHYRAVFVADAAGVGSTAEAEAYRGMTEALGAIPCSQTELISSRLPSGYVSALQAAVGHHVDLVVAGSFLLTDSVVAVARANPDTRFMLVDPIVPPTGPANLVVLTFRRDQSAFLAGALAAMLTRTGVVAGVYGPGGADDRLERSAFERGAAYVRPGVTVLGAFQPADAGEPYNDPSWGAAQARAFGGQQADVIFGTGADTGVGALRGASGIGRLCIGSELPSIPALPACLVATTRVSIDRGVRLAVQQVQQEWHSGLLVMGLADDAVGLEIRWVGISADVKRRLQVIAQQLVDGRLGTGV